MYNPTSSFARCVLNELDDLGVSYRVRLLNNDRTDCGLSGTSGTHDAEIPSVLSIRQSVRMVFINAHDISFVRHSKMKKA